MSSSLQQHLYTLVNSPSGMTFLDFKAKSNFINNDQSAAMPDLESAIIGGYLFFISDLLLYSGIILVIIVLGALYSKIKTSKLSGILINISTICVYTSSFFNLLGLGISFDFLIVNTILLFDSSYSFSVFSQIFKVLLSLTAISIYAMFPYVTAYKMRLLELPLLTQIAIALSATAFSSNNLALMLLSVEGFSLILYIMTALGRTYGGVTASVKYFAFGTLGSIFLFWGLVHFYTLAPSLSLDVINFILNLAYLESASFCKSLDFASAAFTLGFMLKLGAAPTHQWVPDVYSGVHMYITAFFSIFVKFVLVVVYIKVAFNFNCESLLTESAVFSLIVGCFMSVNQTEIKRLLAYSSIVHVAFFIMGDVVSSLIYLITYIISSMIIFSVLLNTELAGKEIIYLNELKFIRSAGGFNLFCLVVALASSAGLPPFAGFYGKFLIWSSLIEDIYISNSFSSYLLLFLSIAVSLITIYYYMKIIAYLFVGHDNSPKGSRLQTTLGTEFYHIVISSQTLLLFLLLFWTFVQPYAVNLIQLSTLSL